MKITPVDGDRFAIGADYFSGALQAIARSIPGLKWAPVLRRWVGYPDAIELAIAVWRSRGLTLDDSAFVGRRSGSTVDGRRHLYDSRLRDYQRTAVDFLTRTPGALLADDMGLGKTATALVAAAYIDGRTLIICPSYVRGVWANPRTGGEIRKWLPDTNVFCPTGVKTLQPIPIDATHVVIHYDIVHAWVDMLQAWAPTVVVLDECHALMSESSRRSKAVKQVCERARFRWGLSGTPMTNRLKDLWNVVDTLSPGRFGEFFAYGVRYCAAEKVAVTPTKTVWAFDGRSNLPELHSRLGHFMLRRTKADVALELPPKTRQAVYVDVPAKSVTMLTAASKTALRQSLDGSANAKLPAATELINEHLAAGHKVIAFTHRRSVAELMVDGARVAGLSAHVIHGGISTLRRSAAVKLAKNASGACLLACTIDSSSTGVDFSFADVGVFVELTWEPHELLQAEARLDRFGQRNPVLIQYILARGSSDELVAASVIDKLDSFESTIGKSDTAFASDLRGTQSEDDILASIYVAIEKGKTRANA